MTDDKFMRLQNLLYEYFFNKDVLYKNRVIDVLNSLNLKHLDCDILIDLHNRQLQYDTFSAVMDEVLSILRDVNRGGYLPK